jgi:PIN domain nuclease of toxin-antitoxin system
MKFLLDTHLLLWAAGQPERLSKPARELIENPDNMLFSAQPAFGKSPSKAASAEKISKPIHG